MSLTQEEVHGDDIAKLRAQVEELREARVASAPPRPSARVLRRRREEGPGRARRAKRRRARAARRKNRPA